MSQRHKMEREFDGILKQAIPLILFSYPAYRNILLEKIRLLYGAFAANNADNFNTLFDQTLAVINNRERVDSNRERLIETFINRDKTYEERLLDLDDKFRKLTKQISLLKRRPIKRTLIKEIGKGKKNEEKRKVTPIEISSQKATKRPQCICGNEIHPAGKFASTGQRRWKCDKRYGGCGKYYKEDKDGRLYRVEEGNKIFAIPAEKKEKKEGESL